MSLAGGAVLTLTGGSVDLQGRPTGPLLLRPLLPSACPRGTTTLPLVGHVCPAGSLLGGVPLRRRVTSRGDIRRRPPEEPCLRAALSRPCPAIPGACWLASWCTGAQEPPSAQPGAADCPRLGRRQPRRKTRPPAAHEPRVQRDAWGPVCPGPPCLSISCTSWFMLLNHHPARLWVLGVPSLTVVKPCVGVTRAILGRGSRPGRQRKRGHHPRVQEETARGRVAAGTAVLSEPAAPPPGTPPQAQLFPLPWLEVEQ